MNNVTATATDGTNNRGVGNFVSSSPTIRNSSLTGSDSSIVNSNTSSVKVADTALGGAVDGDGFFCVGVYNTDFAAANANC